MIFILFLTAFNLFHGFSLIFPIFPEFVKQLYGNPYDVGILVSIQPFMQFLFSPLWGMLSDKLGLFIYRITSILIDKSNVLITIKNFSENKFSKNFKIKASEAPALVP